MLEDNSTIWLTAPNSVTQESVSRYKLEDLSRVQESSYSQKNISFTIILL